MWVAFATLASVVPLATCRSAPLVPILLMATEMKLVAIALVVAFVTIVLVHVCASQDSSELDASIRLHFTKLSHIVLDICLYIGMCAFVFLFFPL